MPQIPKNMSRLQERRGTRHVLLGGFIVAIIIFGGAVGWYYSHGFTSGPNSQVQRSNQGAGQSAVGKAGRGVPGQYGDRAREITQSAEPLQLNDQQRAQIKSFFAGRSTAKAGHVDFPVSIGANVPAQVKLEKLPDQVSTILNGYKGDQYTVVNDQLVIVDTQSRRVDAIIPGVV